MARVKSKNTKPELAVRRTVYHLGYRYRLHPRDLPGSPDVVFRARKKVIFVHGCFWHRHHGCRKTTTPKTRAAFWRAKFKENVVRDERNMQALRAAGWASLVIWECQTLHLADLERRIVIFMNR